MGAFTDRSAKTIECLFCVVLSKSSDIVQVIAPMQIKYIQEEEQNEEHGQTASQPHCFYFLFIFQVEFSSFSSWKWNR
jgi:hypothetical protein